VLREAVRSPLATPAEPTSVSRTTQRTRRQPPLLVGWREWVRLDGLGCEVPVKAKVDSGAATSALHAPSLRRFEREGRPWVSFVLRPRQATTADSCRVEAPVVGYRRVRSSNGRSELRPVIETSISIGDRRWRIELTLTQRSKMRFRMLLGRRAIRGRALLDVSLSHAAGLPLHTEERSDPRAKPPAVHRRSFGPEPKEGPEPSPGPRETHAQATDPPKPATEPASKEPTS